ncbi:class I adenylate-forming enzyme family protein [Saccharopolyspora sp. NPDC050642]|uniref:class I adenylate-forming enzyme family protein n=1 Tax=Saccharopolyspora sp. NPDC050642 TaxID=3157099 RepID=UPI0034092128
MTQQPRRPAWTLEHPDVAFDAVLAGAARAYPDRIALRDGDTTLTHAEVYDRARRVAQGLRRHGVAPGDVVALHLPNTIWFPVAYCGVLLAGAAACAVNPLQPTAVLAEQLAGFGATAVVTHPAFAPSAVEARTPDVRLTVVVPPTHAAPAPDNAGPPAGTIPFTGLLANEPLDADPLDPDSLAHLQLTGGTTGRSKGVRILHRNLVANLFLSSHPRCGGVPALDTAGGVYYDPVAGTVPPGSELGRGVALAVAPLFHGAGLVGLLAGTLMGFTCIIEGRFEPELFLEHIEKYGVTRIFGVPALFHALLSSPGIATRDLSSVGFIMSGAAPIDTTTLRRIAEAFPRATVTEVYGLSEATTILTMQDPRPGAAPAPVGSVGIAAPNTVVELRDEEGEPVPAGQAGEIWAHGPQIADGYHNAPEQTAAQFVDGWLRTGDLGRFDDRGNLHVVGRCKDMIIYKGYNVYPVQLEEILGSHPEVAQSAVVGAPQPGVGEIPIAFVVPRTPAPDPDLAERLAAFVAERVAPYQRIREVRLVDELPLTPTGKVLKRELRRQLA